MNNKEFINALSVRCDLSTKEAKQLVESMVSVFANALEETPSISIPGFGIFEVKKRNERVIVNPSTHLRQLIPPKLTLTFKVSNALKEKINQ